jgi:hypothetical protein
VAPPLLTFARAKKEIDAHGILLVYPLASKPTSARAAALNNPPSLFSVAYPGVKMSWKWTDDADDRVVRLWHLRMRLAESREVVYAKWFRDRATFFSLPVFRAMLGGLSQAGDTRSSLSMEARDVLEVLEDDSPMSTKLLRTNAGLRGAEHNARWARAMSELFARLYIVAVGEVEDGAFPSLAVGATSLLFENEWSTRTVRDPENDTALHRALMASPAFKKQWDKNLSRVRPTPEDVDLSHMPGHPLQATKKPGRSESAKPRKKK